MRFWIGLFISFFGGLVGIGFFREWIKLSYPLINDLHLDCGALIILIIGLVVTAIDHSIQSRNLKLLEDEQKGRVLTPKQRENLVDALSNLGKIKIVLIGIQGDRESIRFANSIKDILIEANWEVDGVWEDIIIGGVGFGITLRESSSEPDSSGKIINEIMNENQIKSRVVLKSDLKPNLIEIIAGSRP
ncbi:hypothetical protein [Flavobacterium sp. 2]|uniref:hypothetical protein n=1 Tax=Flavobacterium sp. 2 TaxID=308053 RepID=UPI000C1A2082|nr:hypothetical protein [Flavobacterium sp. 2]PIF60048.1 hypothetical protein CLU99_3293 [Flavobacterium sp. 2]